MGCLRTMEEIRRWPAMTDYEQKMLLEELEERPYHVGSNKPKPM
jgi:predicted Fe-S protein YdhL (DUF1289 family)